jgi:F-type H+-transporting ATPase subunit b
MDALGLNPILLISQLISFGVLFFVLKKFLYGSIRKTLEERRENIRKIGISGTEAEKKLVELEVERTELEKNNQIELRKLLLDTQKNAEEIKKEILDNAEVKSQKIIEEAGERVKEEKIKASNDLKLEAGKLAKEMAAKILSEPVNNKKSIDLSINELKKITKKKAQHG